MKIPSPAIVEQEAVRRFPRWALITLCLVYALAGLMGREPWRSEDLAGFAYFLDIFGSSPAVWLLTRSLVFVLLCLTCTATWYSTYYLARRDSAQPVPFAFGGEARPIDYARAIADGALLALLASLGLAQIAHETSAALLQMTMTSLLFFALTCYRYHPIKSAAALAISSLGLFFLVPRWAIDSNGWASPLAWRESLHMLVWFAWPAWALALVALLKWRRHWLRAKPSLHIGLPFLFVLLFLVFVPVVDKKDRWFLSALPSLSVLAAFALPTLRRGIKSLVDLFTLIFFCGCALVIWVVWIAMQTGFPPQPAANVARLLPAFMPTFSAPVFLLALAATAVWGWLVYWRIGKHSPALWMSMVLPAGGAALCWALLMSLWLPLLDHARSYRPLIALVQKHIDPIAKSQTPHGCLYIHGLNAAQQAALRYYTQRPLVQTNRGETCDWLITEGSAEPSLSEYTAITNWQPIATLRRPSDKSEDWLIYARKK